MNEVSRRGAMLALASGGVVLLSGCTANAQQTKAPAPVLPNSSATGAGAALGTHAVRPLPFDATKLNGLSERLLISHHDNNYAAAVKNLNRVEEELARTSKETPPFVVGGLKQSELAYRNSATLHELYFGNLGGGGRASGEIEKTLAQASGSFSRWEETFRATGASLGGGSGWVVTAWDLHRDAAVTYWSGNHTQVLASAVPLLVMDMYEHAYQMDYGAAAAKYIDAFFANIQWEEVATRLTRARQAALAFRR